MPIERRDLDLTGLALLRAQRIGDDRGWFREVFSARRLEEIGIRAHFVQDNMSCSAAAGTLRGLHAQRPPMAQAKLVVVVEGAIFAAGRARRPLDSTGPSLSRQAEEKYSTSRWDFATAS